MCIRDRLGLVQQAVLLQLQLDEPGAHAGGIDRGVDGPEDIGQRTDVVLMPVGDKDAPDLVLVLDQIAHIGDDHVDAVHIVIGKAHAAVDHHDVSSVFVYGEVLPDLVQTAQRNDFQFFCHDNSFISCCMVDVTDRKRPRKTRCTKWHSGKAKGGAPPRPCLAG